MKYSYDVERVAITAAVGNGEMRYMWQRSSEMMHGISLFLHGLDNDASDEAEFIAEFFMQRSYLCGE